MDFTFALSVQYGLSPFVILNQDKDRVIMLINYFIQKGEQQPQAQDVAKSATTQKQSRYDGFWNF